MRRRIILCVIFLTALNCCNLFSQDVTLHGRQFKDGNGNDFYPVCMNYLVDMVCTPTEWNNHGTPDPTGYFPAPGAQYGTTTYAHFHSSTQQGCYDDLLTDFSHIKDMGFNSVHIAGLAPRTNSATSALMPTPGLYIYRDCTPNEYNYDYHQLTPLQVANDPFVNILFSCLDDVIVAANSIGLKVIIDGQTNDRFVFPGDFDFYSEYLTALAQHFHSSSNQVIKQTLIAYIITGEPYWGDNDAQRKKYDVCESTQKLYDALHNTDPDHLVGAGGMNVQELYHWDPEVIKADFYFPHIYLQYPTYEGTNLWPPNNIPAAMDRLYAALYWMKDNLTKPYMIGETGFSADPNCSNSRLDGDESQQVTFFQDVLAAIRNNGGSGVAIWQYKNVFWDNPAGGYQDDFGLLEHGDEYATSPGWTTLQKPAVNVFRNYLDWQGHPPAQIPPTQEPDNYYDPYHTYYYSHISQQTAPQTVTGTVTNQNNNQVKGALLTGHTFMQYDPNHFPNPIDNVFQTFSHVNGSYSITPFDFLHPVNSSTQYVRWLEVSAPGSAYVENNHWWWPGQGNPFIQIPLITSPCNPALPRVSDNINGTVLGQMTISSQNNRFQALQTLTVSNDVIVSSNASADFTALNEVHVESEFHAVSGSEVHIYNSVNQINCDDIIDANPPDGFRIPKINNTSTSHNYLELIFNKYFQFVKIFPNPGTGFFNIEYAGKMEYGKSIKVFDLTGNMVFESTFSGFLMSIDLSILPKGIYSLQLNDQLQLYNQTLVLQ